jgi:hypothetical protein
MVIAEGLQRRHRQFLPLWGRRHKTNRTGFQQVNTDSVDVMDRVCSGSPRFGFPDPLREVILSVIIISAMLLDQAPDCRVTVNACFDVCRKRADY